LTAIAFVRHEAEVAALERYGISFADAATYLVGALELVGGLALVLGVGTRLARSPWLGNWPWRLRRRAASRADPFTSASPRPCVVMLALIWAGAGRLSLDGRLAGPGARTG
jgi:uncharacterized membrane protein YphA (DoxX/SURF4 family)